MALRLIASLLFLSLWASAQNNPVTPQYPGGAADDSHLGVSADRAYSMLDASLDPTDTTITVVDGTAFPDAEYWIVVCPEDECRLGATAANGETIAICGKTSTHVLDICATGREVQGDATGTSTGDAGNPTHAVGEAVVLTIVGPQWNGLAAEVARLTAIDAGDLAVTPAGGIAASNAQAALEELDAEKAPAVCNFEYVRTVTGRNGGTIYHTGNWGTGTRGSPSGLTWDYLVGQAFDTVNEAVTWTLPVPSCYSSQTMDLRLYFVRYSVGSVDQVYTVKTVFKAHDEATANSPTFNSGQTFTLADADVSASGDLLVKTISGLTMTGATAGDLAYIDLEVTTDTSGTGLLLGWQIVQQ
jgi:hypothetical protein